MPITNVVLGIPESNITMDMDWDTSYDFLTADSVDQTTTDITLADTVILRGEGGTYSTANFLNFPDHPVTFKAQVGYTFTLITTAYTSITSDGQIMGDANIALVGDKSDDITLKKVSITNGNGTFIVSRQV
jgi:hypothetical protein